MSKISRWLLLALAFQAQAAEITPQPWEALAAGAAATLISHHHYQPRPLDDALSAEIFSRYLKLLDPERFFLTQADVDQLTPYRKRLDDAIHERDLNAPFTMFRLYHQRAGERFALARALLKNEFRFDDRERFTYRRDKAEWAASEAELRDLWRLRVKNDWLRLKIAGKAEDEIRSTLD